MFAHADPFLSLHCSQDCWASGHGCPAADPVDEVQPAQDQDVPGRELGGLGPVGWFSSHNWRASSRGGRFHHLWIEPKKVAITSSLILNSTAENLMRPKTFENPHGKVRGDLRPSTISSAMVI